MNIEKTLQGFGLNQKRSKIYLTLLGLKKASVAELAKKTGILRTTVYDGVNFLKQINLISEIFENGKKLLVAESPENFKNILKLREIELESILPSLTEQFQAKKTSAKIKFYEGPEGVKKLHEEILINGENKTLYSMGNMNLLRDYVSKSYTQNFITKRLKLKMDNKVLLSGGRETYTDNPLFSDIENIKAMRQVKTVPRSVNFSMFIMVIGEKVLFCSEKSEGYSFVFESVNFSQTLLSIFNILWAISEPFNS